MPKTKTVFYKNSSTNHECEDDTSVANYQQPKNSQKGGEKVQRRGPKKDQSQFLSTIEEIHSNHQKQGKHQQIGRYFGSHFLHPKSSM